MRPRLLKAINYPAYYVLNEMYITPLELYIMRPRLLKAINYPAYYVLNEMYITPLIIYYAIFLHGDTHNFTHHYLHILE